MIHLVELDRDVLVWKGVERGLEALVRLRVRVVGADADGARCGATVTRARVVIVAAAGCGQCTECGNAADCGCSLEHAASVKLESDLGRTRRLLYLVIRHKCFSPC